MVFPAFPSSSIFLRLSASRRPTSPRDCARHSTATIAKTKTAKNKVRLTPHLTVGHPVEREYFLAVLRAFAPCGEKYPLSLHHEDTKNMELEGRRARRAIP